MNRHDKMLSATLWSGGVIPTERLSRHAVMSGWIVY